MITAGAALAQPGDPPAQPGDPPSRVARLNYLNGDVSFRPGSVDDWAAASLNYPMTNGDHLWTDAGARAELHVGSTAIRLDSQTAFAILNLDDHTVQLSLTGGSLNIRIRDMQPDEVYEVDTPNSAMVLKPGNYRISTDGDRNTTTVTVGEGEATINGGGESFPVNSRQMERVTGVDTLSQETTPMLPPDDFDGWCGERERREQSTVSARYVPRDMIGYEDLDAYGVWREVPPYGWVWSPRSVVAGWAPYHNGHWAWVEPWGWTWIDDAPWGFAPFHYGRWAYAGGGWLWVPGRRDVAVRPVYAPALVAFVGGPRFGVAVGVGAGIGMAAWFPLGPGEVYRPAYHVSDVYVRRINVVHVTNVTVINQVNVTNVRYVNQTVPGAVVAVPHDAFVGARPVASAAVRVDAREVASAPVTGTAGFAPRRESVLAGSVRPSAPPARFAQRQVVTRTAPPPPPVSFAAKQQALESNGGRPLDANTMNTIRNNSPARPSMVRPANVPPSGGRPANAPPSGVRPGYAPPAVRNDRPPVRTPDVRPSTPPGNTVAPTKNESVPNRNLEDRKVTPATNTPTPPNTPPVPNRNLEERKVNPPATPPANTVAPPRNETTPNRNVEERKGQPARKDERKSTKK